MKIMQWETSATEKLKTLFLMLFNSSSLFQLKCILMCNIRKEHSPMLKEIFRPALQCLGNLQTSNSRFQGLKEKKNHASIPVTKAVQDPQATPGKCEIKK